MRALAIATIVCVAACEGTADPPLAPPAGGRGTRSTDRVATGSIDPLTPPSERAADEAAIARGRDAFDRFECARCHAHEATTAVEPSRDCAGCHRAIRDGTYTRDGVTPEMTADFRAHVRHLVEIPALDHLDGWLARDAVAAYLLAPHDVRPALDDDMPSLPLSADEASDLAAFLVPSASRELEVALASDAATIERGRAHAERLACPSCHALGALWPPPAAALSLAPDLAFVRERVQRGALVAFLIDPSATRPGAAMPRLVPDEVTAREIASFLVHTPLPTIAPTAFVRLPPLDRPVTFDEVEQRVLRRSCWHCHSDETLAYGDGGPGNTGGFGFAAREIDLSSYTHVMAGGLDREGARVSLFREIDGEPALLRALLARHDEVRGVIDPDVRGMPLGLPPLDADQIQLVESWIAQGRPR